MSILRTLLRLPKILKKIDYDDSDISNKTDDRLYDSLWNGIPKFLMAFFYPLSGRKKYKKPQKRWEKKKRK